MKTRLVLTCIGLLALTVPATAQRGADAATPRFWSAADMAAIDSDAAGRVSPETHMAAGNLIPQAFVVYRTGPSMAEAHEASGDLIFVREGEGMIQVGGEIVGGTETRPGEMRGEAIRGGTEYPVAAGDMLYVPARVPHQFFVEDGKHWAITIVKVAPPG